MNYYRLTGKRYFGSWKCHNDVLESFRDLGSRFVPEGFPRDDQILFACNTAHSSYEESCVVVFMTADGLRLVDSSHCSCDGFDWKPEPTSWFQLHRTDFTRTFMDWDDPLPAHAAWAELIGNNVITPVDIVMEDEQGVITVTRDMRGCKPEHAFWLVPATYLQIEQPTRED